MYLPIPRRLRRRPIVAALVVAVAWAVLGAAAAHAQADAPETTLDVQGEPVKVSVLQGRVVWSRYDSRAKRFRLMLWNQGKVTKLPIPGSGVAFDADLGIDQGGKLVVTYSRCRKAAGQILGSWPEYSSVRGCRPWQYRLGAAREHPLGPKPPKGRSWVLPSRWRDQLLVYDAPERHRGGTVRALRLDSKSPPKALPRGLDSFEVRGGPATLDVRDGQVAYDWLADLETRCPDTDAPPNDEGGIYDFDVMAGPIGGPVRRVARGCTFDPVKQASSPSIGDAGLRYVLDAPDRGKGHVPVLHAPDLSGPGTDWALGEAESFVSSASADGGLIVVCRVSLDLRWHIALLQAEQPAA